MKNIIHPLYHKIKFLLFLLCLPILGGCWSDDEDSTEDTFFASGKGVVNYTSYAPLADKPIRIHYIIPEKDNPTQMPILFVFPGLERNASDYLKAWEKEAETRNIMVFVFEFPDTYYSTEQYIEGGMFVNGTLVNRLLWSFSIVEAVFDAIRRDTGSKQQKYNMWGHSAGAQFVHRYLTFITDSHIDRAVSANAGWYTIPDPEISYPYGLQGTGFDKPENLKTIFARKLIVQLGTDDTSRTGLNTTEGAEAQGKNRFQRGSYYIERATSIANEGHYTFNWIKQDIPGVAHEYSKMVSPGAKALFDAK